MEEAPAPQHIPNFKGRLRSSVNMFPLILQDAETRTNQARENLARRQAEQVEIDRRMSLLPGLGRE